MSKIVYFLVILAVFAQAYGVPAEEGKDAEEAVSAVEAPAADAKEQIQGAAGENSPADFAKKANNFGERFYGPYFKAAKEAVKTGQNAFDGVFNENGPRQ